MLIRRCAWHREFHGYTLVYGVAAWRGLSVKFTDGVCRGCAARVRIEWRVAGRDAETYPGLVSPIISPRLRRAVLTGGIVLIAAALPSVGPISDRRLGAIHHEYPLTAGRNELAAGRPEATTTAESERPRVRRPRSGPTATTKARPSRLHASRRAAPAVWPAVPAPPILPPAVPVVVSMAAPVPGEDEVTTAQPMEIAEVAPSLSRPLLIEEEFTLRVRRASLTRLSLFPPPERPRHAGLTIQGP